MGLCVPRGGVRQRLGWGKNTLLLSGSTKQSLQGSREGENGRTKPQHSTCGTHELRVFPVRGGYTGVPPPWRAARAWGGNTDRGVSLSAVGRGSRVARRASRAASPLEKPVGTPSPGSSSGFSGPVAVWFWVQLRGFPPRQHSGLWGLANRQLGRFLTSVDGHAGPAQGALPELLLEPYKGPAAISLMPFRCVVYFHSPQRSSAVRGAAPPLPPLAMVLNCRSGHMDNILPGTPVPASCACVGATSPF